MGLDLAVSVLTIVLAAPRRALFVYNPALVVAQLSSDTKLHPVFFDPESSILCAEGKLERTSNPCR